MKEKCKKWIADRKPPKPRYPNTCKENNITINTALLAVDDEVFPTETTTNNGSLTMEF